MRLSAILLSATLVLAGCSSEITVSDPVSLVNPFIGTGEHGHTYPGASVPYGMVQPGPDTRTEGWDACSGYHYSDGTILGFSQTHLTGTGCADLTDFLVYPSAGEINVAGDTLALEPYKFSHESETASPGYYSVTFSDSPIKTEITSTCRTAVYRFTFSGGEARRLAFDLKHSTGTPTVRNIEWKQLSDKEMEGMRVVYGFMENGRYAHFNARFSEPAAKVAAVNDSQFIVEFDREVNEITLAMGFSVTSCENARLNSVTEVPQLDFDAVRSAAAGAWKQALSSVEIPKGDKDDLTVFYTALYHTKLAPTVNSDVNGEYRSHDGSVKAMPKGKTYYSTLSYWDIFRSWLPMNSLLDHNLLNDIASSSLLMYDATGELPIWPLGNGETDCMIGYHCIPFLAEAYLDGYGTFDPGRALDAMVASSCRNHKYSDLYIQYGYIPADGSREGVSITLEYAYDDWCIARVAEKMGNREVADEYYRRAQNFRNIFDGGTLFFRGKNSDGSLEQGFDPDRSDRNFTEAIPWHYRFFVPHDFNGLASLYGDCSITDAIDSLFTTDLAVKDIGISDVTGQYGIYAHGNEPSHHNAYLYDYAGQPWKTQKITRDLLAQMYGNSPEGIVGNEDCGQMSAWYVMTALGLYEACPGSGEYCLTTPLFKEADLRLANGKTLKITASDPSKSYIKSVSLNGSVIDRNFITYDEIMGGGELSFELCAEPFTGRGTSAEDAPYSQSKENLLPAPYTTSQYSLFTDEAVISLGCRVEGAEIRYTTDGSEPAAESALYSSPIRLTGTTTVKAAAFKDGMEKSGTLTVNATKAEFLPAAKAEGLTAGVDYTYREGEVSKCQEIESLPVKRSGTMAAPSIESAEQEDHFAFTFSGFIDVPEKAVREFWTISDDGSVLFIDGQKVVDSDGGHSAMISTGKIALDKGLHSFRLLYFEDYEGQELSWGWKDPAGGELKAIPAERLFRKEK